MQARLFHWPNRMCAQDPSGTISSCMVSNSAGIAIPAMIDLIGCMEFGAGVADRE
jgi:hypothetical protein